jgi:sugar transferase EpsL|tara:strand:+ start:44 stop:652 length:609 start_codon:yes stop_codon:yes gene_type:complete
MLYKYFKIIFDYIFSAIALLLLSPLILLTAFLTLLFIGKPIFFSQERPGLHGKSFIMYKFRTMNNDRDSDQNLLPDKERLGNFGKLLRSISIDELPTLINILKGEMSLVGPRPLLLRYLDRYNPQQSRRHEIKPGITGLAQVKGRNTISWDEKFRLDVWYVDHLSFWLDIKILGMTIVKVINRDGITQVGRETMDEFFQVKK